MNLLKSLGILAIAASSARADYVNSTVSLGGYVLDAKDANHDGDFYQMERVNLAILKNGVGLHVAYGYSDFYDKRPNTYKNSNRLALANVNYSPIPGRLNVTAGRDFMPMIERSLYYDGGDAKLQYGSSVQAELFGGYGVPSVYQNKIVDFNGDRTLIGGKLTYTPISALQVQFDGLMNGKSDDGSLGGNVRGRIGDRVTLSANSVFRLDSNYFSHVNLTALKGIRKHDELQLRAGMEETKVDSTRIYDYFVNKKHEFLFAGYLLYLNDQISANLDGGVLMYGDTLGETIDFQANLYGFFARIGREFSSVPNALDVRIGYGNVFGRYLRVDASSGYTQYDLDPQKTGLKAMDFTVQPTVMLSHGLEVTASYEYLHNRLYDSDNRFFFGIKEAFSRGFHK